MQFQQDYQSADKFIFPEVKDFDTESMPVTVESCFIDSSVVVAYSQKSWLKKMLALPKVAIFALEGLMKVSSFANDLQNAIKKMEGRISILEDSHGDFRLLNDRLYKVEMNAVNISELKLQLDTLTQKNRSMFFGMIALALLNLGLVTYFFLR